MKIFPAIDIKDKKCVRLIKGDFENKTEYETSPIDQAKKYQDYGFKDLHIVDLDGALTGRTVNLDIIKEVVSKHDLKIEIGGGVRTLDSVKKYVDVGVDKVILGSAAIKNKEFLKEACEKFKNKSHMYFVHSYEFIPEDKSVISATTDYSSKIVCSVEKENIFGTQFHPEKSDKIGLKIIHNFISL